MRYHNGLEAPCDYELATGNAAGSSYSPCTVAEHIRRDLREHQEMLLTMEAERQRVENENRLRAMGIEPESLSKGGSGKGKKKKKK